jgi:hypothetical protein
MPALATAAKPRPDSDTRVPAEALGRARRWREALTVPSTQWATGSAMLLIPFGGPNRSPHSRRTLLNQLPRRWHALPDFGRLDLWAERGDPTRIREARCVPHTVGMKDWRESELSIAILLRRVAVALTPRPAVTDQSVVGAVISLHGLARYLARCCPIPTDLDMTRDLLALIDTARWRSTARGTDVEVEGGVWRGHAAHLDNVPTLSIRTFVTEAS